MKTLSCFRFRSNIIFFGLCAAVITAIIWLAFPFLNPANVTWNGIDEDEQRAIVVVMKENFPEWSRPPKCSAKNLFTRIQGVEIAEKSTLVEKSNDGYTVIVKISSHGFQEEYARFLLSKGFVISSVRMRFD